MSNRKPWIATLLCLATAPLSMHARAEESATPAARWVSGSAVNLRAQASAAADVVARLALNTRVELVSSVAPSPPSPYCEVNATLADGKAVHGFTACEYLSPQPIDVNRIAGWRRDDGTPNPDYDPAKAFSIAPTWDTLMTYANFLHGTKLTDEERANPPRGVRTDPQLERMKEHLAKGIYGPPPAPLADWASLEQEAAAPNGPAKPGVYSVADRSRTTAGRLGAWDVEFAEERPEVIFNLVKAIELPSVRPSLFMDEADIGPPQESAVALSGRFHLIHTWRTRPRSPAGSDDAYQGVWDIKSATASLVAPVFTATLHRDGRVDSASSFALQTVSLYSELVDGPMCEGYEDGFAFGEADAATWRYLYPDMNQETLQSLPKRSPGSLLRFHLRKAPPQAMARMSITRQVLDRRTTGLVKATTMPFDLDHDGVPDLVVWEGVGHGPGHMGPRTETDDAWLRIFFVNIAGRWKVLGSDRFGYGCGC